ncbi:uncharacterized protein [Zea mays]|uniref:Uncharacterized protein n=1 Tax=Zea mays TaxID=4577 RepID=A0A1D6NKW6_MAIZE|nr:uncharacterized protein LOC103651536 [Zea mays]ONM40872.1 hypothetical protein ZEAMMB73_Zm00001d044316 [Zea mays]|eukprot:XP_008675407.1 uncharacterized protein LOC103651536 [Zea mays]
MASCEPKGSAKGARGAPEACAVADIDPKLELYDGANTYVIRLNLPGFKKEDFKVQLNSGGWLTVRGERPAGYVRFHRRPTSTGSPAASTAPCCTSPCPSSRCARPTW